MGRSSRPEVRRSARGQGGPGRPRGLASRVGFRHQGGALHTSLLPRRKMSDHWGSRPGRGAGFQGPRQTESLLCRESKAPKGKNVSFRFHRGAVAGSLGREGMTAREETPGSLHNRAGRRGRAPAHPARGAQGRPAPKAAKPLRRDRGKRGPTTTSGRTLNAGGRSSPLALLCARALRPSAP